MLKKLSSFAQAIDRCGRASRELVWSHVFYLYNHPSPSRKCNDLFSPIIDEWCQSQSIDLSAIEIMYTSFLQIYNQYPGLFEDVLTPATPSSESSHFSLYPPSSPPSPSPSPSYSMESSKSMMDFNSNNSNSNSKREEQAKIKTIKLNNTSLIWGCAFSSSVQQFSLVCRFFFNVFFKNISMIFFLYYDFFYFLVLALFVYLSNFFFLVS